MQLCGKGVRGEKNVEKIGKNFLRLEGPKEIGSHVYIYIKAKDSRLFPRTGKIVV